MKKFLVGLTIILILINIWVFNSAGSVDIGSKQFVIMHIKQQMDISSFLILTLSIGLIALIFTPICSFSEHKYTKWVMDHESLTQSRVCSVCGYIEKIEPEKDETTDDSVDHWKFD